MRTFLLFYFVFIHFSYGQTFDQVKVHSHNDYLQDNPFWEAYKNGAYSIEVDVFLRNGTLFVAHDESEIETEDEIETLYLKPLKVALEEKYSREVQLLIDIKSEALKTLSSLILVLEKYPSLLHSEKIMFVISGHRPQSSKYIDYPDYISFDYQSLNTIDDADIWKKVALISLPFHKYSQWNGENHMTKEEQQHIEEIIKKAHLLNKPFRFWATPDNELAWETFSKIGLDFINTDQPAKCFEFLKSIKKGRP